MRPFRLSVLLVAAVGAAIMLKGAWIPIKAWAAYRFMDDALVAAGQSGAPERPWSWADFRVAGALTIAGHRVHVLDRATGQALAFGAGLHEEYGFPADPVVLSGHRDTHFQALADLKAGDTLEYSQLGQSRRYTVTETRIFDLREGTLRLPPKGTLLLITCWPFEELNPNTPKRFLVLATAEDGPAL